MFDVSVLDNNGNMLISNKGTEDKAMDYHYSWKFSPDASWLNPLFDFKDIASEELFVNAGAKNVPIGVMKCVKNTTVMRSEEEFFDLYGEESVDFSFDLTKLISDRLRNAEYEVKQYIVSFDHLGAAFCKLVREISETGFYNCLRSNVITTFYQQYTKIADSICNINSAKIKSGLKTRTFRHLLFWILPIISSMKQIQNV